MKLIRSVLLSALASTAAIDAWEITSSASGAPETILGEHETVAKTWTVSGTSALSGIDVHSIGRVFVDYDASLASGGNATLSRVVAKVVLTGTKSDLLDAYEVVNVDDKESAVKLRFKNQDFEDKGFLLTQIYVGDKALVDQLGLSWSADVVIGEDVLVNKNASAHVGLALAGSGSIFAGSSDAAIELGSLDLAVAGSGDIQFLAKTLDFNRSLSVNIAGSGDIGVVADVVKVANLETAIAGSGDAFVQATSVDAYNLTTAIAGSGSATYSRGGSCQQQEVSIAGSGDVAAGSIICVDTTVNVIGSGDVVVQTTGNLTVAALFSSGDIRYFGAKPEVIDVDSSFSFRGSHKKQFVKPTKKNHFDEYEVEPTPARKPVFIALKTDKSLFSDHPNVEYLVEDDMENDALVNKVQQNVLQNAHIQGQSLAARTFTHPHTLALSAVVVGAAFAAVGVATHKYKTRTERARYQPLI